MNRPSSGVARFWLPSGYFELHGLTMEQIAEVAELFCKHYPGEPDPEADRRYELVMRRELERRLKKK